MIIWNQHKLETLEEAIETAEVGGHHTVIWTETERPSMFSRKGIEHNWSITEARETARRVRADLAAHPMPASRPNKEGPEP